MIQVLLRKSVSVIAWWDLDEELQTRLRDDGGQDVLAIRLTEDDRYRIDVSCVGIPRPNLARVWVYRGDLAAFLVCHLPLG